MCCPSCRRRSGRPCARRWPQDSARLCRTAATWQTGTSCAEYCWKSTDTLSGKPPRKNCAAGSLASASGSSRSLRSNAWPCRAGIGKRRTCRLTGSWAFVGLTRRARVTRTFSRVGAASSARPTKFLLASWRTCFGRRRIGQSRRAVPRTQTAGSMDSHGIRRRGTQSPACSTPSGSGVGGELTSERQESTFDVRPIADTVSAWLFHHRGYAY
mmetsp:Transcript_21318/g.59483  ORF Transcript_21318/g.59483 Transcript_21318/m.59483 type:complete len:213 (+) Transcript_21318:1322-1960(+)